MPEPSHISAGHRRATSAGRWLLAAAAIAMILGSDHLLRARQHLVEAIANHSDIVLLPVSDFLSQRVDRKTMWNVLHDRIARDHATGNTGDAIKASYDLEKFIRTDLSPTDDRRRQVLEDLVTTAGDSPTSEEAYWSLFAPEWKSTLQPKYAGYAAALTKIGRSKGKNGIDLFQQLAAVLEQRGEPVLELQALRSLHALSPVTINTEPQMSQLLSLLPPADPERAGLQDDLSKFNARRESLTASMNWYAGFRAKENGNVADLEALRATAPKGPMNPFIASADASLVTRYLRAGRFDDANRLRKVMAAYDVGDIDEAASLAVQLTEGPSLMPPKGPPPANTPLPDAHGIELNRWRGKLLTGDLAGADAIAAQLFIGEEKNLLRFAKDERDFFAGNRAKITPAVTLAAKSDGIPPELAGASTAWFGQFQLKPIGKATAANITSTADVWVTADQVLFIISADEPRADLTPKATARDQDVWKEDCIELFFDPDRWFDSYYQLDSNSAGVMFDAQMVGNGSLARRQYKMDRAFNFDVKSTASKTPKGWQVRLLVPRAQIFPAGSTAIKFNVRRLRYIQEKGQTLLQSYSWTSTGGGPDHRPEQFGWLLLPQ